MRQNKLKVQPKDPYLEHNETLLDRKKDNGKPYTQAKYMQFQNIRKSNWKKNMESPLEKENLQHARHLAQLSTQSGGLSILDIETKSH